MQERYLVYKNEYFEIYQNEEFAIIECKALGVTRIYDLDDKNLIATYIEIIGKATKGTWFNKELENYVLNEMQEYYFNN